MPAEAIARAIVFAIEQPADVDGNGIIVRPHCAELVRGASRTGAGLTIMTLPEGGAHGTSQHRHERDEQNNR